MTVSRNIALLTATVQPKPGQAALSVTDADARLAQYREALGFYSALVDQGVLDGVVFFDNSGIGVDAIGAQFQRPNVELHSEYGLDYPAGYHRGYGEFKLIDRAYELSPLLQRAGDDSRVWKITGRYQVLNLARMIRAAPMDADFYADIHQGWAEMSVMAWSPRGHAQIVRGLCEHFKTDMAPELILAQMALGDGSLHTVTRWRWPPFIRGTRGANGLPYGGRAPRLRHALNVLGHLWRSRLAGGAAT